MKVINRTYKYRLYPNKKQAILLAEHFGCVRFVYNYFLNQRKEQYKNTKKSDNYYAQCKVLTEMKKNPVYLWLNEVNSQTLQHVLRNLDNAYTNFFKKRSKFPRFHSKKHGGSFAVPQHFKVEGNKLYIPKFKEGIKLIEDKKLEGELRNITVTVTPAGKYYVSIMSEVEYEPLKKTNSKVGIDLGLKDLIITSDGIKYSSNKFIKEYAKHLASAQKHLSRKKKGSNTWNKQCIKTARIQEKISDCRKDKLQKISTDLIRKYDIVFCEDLNVKGMERNHHLARSINDASWYMLVSMLQYKAEWNDKKVIKVDRFYPSSKTCHHCGYVNQDLSLSDRQWICPNCKSVLDRDVNAARNILDEGLKILTSAGTADYTGGEEARANLTESRSSVKPEA